MSWKLIFLGLAVICALAYVSREGFHSKRQGFQNSGNNPDQNTFTMYYADWCGHCKKIKPEFEKFVESGPLTVNGKTCQIRMVSPEKEPDKAKGKDIKGFPSFLMETADGQVVEYKGERNTKGFLDFINKNLGGNSA